MFRLLFRPILATLFVAFFAAPSNAGEGAVSGDGNWRAEIGPPGRLTIYDTKDGSAAKTFEAISREGLTTHFEGVYTDPTRRHFVVPLTDVAEYWLIATDPDAPPVYEGFVHSHEKDMIEGLPSSQGLFARTRVLLEGGTPLGEITFSPDYLEMTGLTPDRCWQVVVNLYVNREIARRVVGECVP